MSEQRSLEFFMKGKAQEIKPEEHIISTRFVDDEGKPIPFVFKAISTEMLEQLQDDCTVPIMRKGKKEGEKLDTKRFGARLAVETTVYPNFKDPQLLASYGCVDPVDLVKKICCVSGEYAELIRVVQLVNKFDEDFEELVDDAKNSSKAATTTPSTSTESGKSTESTRGK